MELYAGIEIGATKQQIVLCGLGGDIQFSTCENVDISEGAKGILRWILAALPPLVAQAKKEGHSVRRAGIGFGGIVESASGRVVLSVQVRDWEDIRLKEWFEQNFRLPALVANDTVCGGFCEYSIGSGAGADTFFYTNIGSGIGGALFFGGKNYDGQGYGAAYFGHTYIPSPYELGGPVKIEDICSGWAIERRLRRPGYVPKTSLLFGMCGGEVANLSCRELHEAAKQNDEFARAEVGFVARSFGLGLANVLTLFHPQVISVGGGVSHFGRLLLDPMEEYARSMAFGPCGGGFRLVQCTHTEMAVPVGAALMAKAKEKEEKEEKEGEAI